MRTIRQAQIIQHQLEKWDPAGDDTLWIRQARQAEQLIRSELWSTVAVETDEKGKARQIYKTPGEYRRGLECWLTFHDCNLMFESDEGERTRLFQKGMSEAAFHAAFAKLDPDLVDEWHAAVLDINPHWDPNRAEEVEKNS